MRSPATASPRTADPAHLGGALINIDNGGTLTDVCVWDGEQLVFTKTLTTPHDLSECLFDGIERASAALYGSKDSRRLLHAAQHIRYSTTQGTNALVQRQGPMIGLLTTIDDLADRLRADAEDARLFEDLVGDRVRVMAADSANSAGSDGATAEADAFDLEIVQSVNRLTTLGAARLVVAGRTQAQERRVREVLLRRFPRHLLGSIPVIYSWELAGDRDDARRTWSCVLNSFLHPTMERFLYGAERRLKEHRVLNPLLVYRNDGSSSRVAKSVALKSYSSGPRGGLEATAALARVYGLPHALMMDIGGTTTDVGVVVDGVIATADRGAVAGAPISFPMSDVQSSGVGGSSVIAVRDGRITVGPDSVGAAPGPACFGFGGRQATITDVNLLLGVLDPDTYLDGTFTLDPRRSEAVITETVASPLGLTLEAALLAMEQAYSTALAATFADLVRPDTTLAAFGGAGPMGATGAARLAGVRRVVIPRTAAVFSAWGISFSDIGKTYEVLVDDPTTQGVAEAYGRLLERAERDMFQEGYDLQRCELQASVRVETDSGGSVERRSYESGDQVDPVAGALTLELKAVAALDHPVLADAADIPTTPAPVAGTRSIRSRADGVDEVPVHVLDELSPGHTGAGPAVVEGPFFTARVLPGWSFTVTATGDLSLTDLG